MEHHSNLLPWQMVCRQTGASLKFMECEMDGTLDLNKVEALITPKTKIVACTHVSNVLGRVNPIRELAVLAHRAGAVLVVDGAQSTPHIPVDVQALDADFFAFSGHKVYGPMGIGVLYGREELLNAMPPFLTGGEMIESVTRKGAVWAEVPHKFEAGTVNAAGAIALHAAIKYAQSVGFDVMQERELAVVQDLCRPGLDVGKGGFAGAEAELEVAAVEDVEVGQIGVLVGAVSLEAKALVPDGRRAEPCAGAVAGGGVERCAVKHDVGGAVAAVAADKGFNIG